MQERKQAQLAALDGQYQTKIMSEVERYQALAQEKEMLNQKWDEQNATLVEAHEKVVQVWSSDVLVAGAACSLHAYCLHYTCAPACVAGALHFLRCEQL